MDATWFQQALDRVGGSQADLARYLRLAPSAVSRMLKGERQMKLLEPARLRLLGRTTRRGGVAAARRGGRVWRRRVP
jgi:predicted transcriptional regulator